MFFVLIASINLAFAQSEESLKVNSLKVNSIYLWVPEKMIQGENYEGLIVLDEAENNAKLAMISSSDDTVVQVDKSILVNQYSNHGIFKITPNGEGIAEIFVSVNGELSSRQVQVYSQKSTPQSLSLYLPSNSTKADEMTAYVFVLDGNAAPVPVKNNTSVHITSTNGVDAEPQVTIKQGEFYTKFLTHVNGDGTIAASNENLKSDTVAIQKIQDNIDVKLAVAPNIIATDSFAYYYVWLEKNRIPFNVPVVIDVILHSSDPGIARLTSTPPNYQNDNIINISMKGGIGKGILYTGKPGHATLTASISQFGSASADVFVGPATIGTQDAEQQIALQEFNSKNGNRLVPDKPNSALLWIYPGITSEKAWGVAALYFSNSTETIDITLDAQGSQVSSIISQDTLYPMTADGRSVTVSSNTGLSHDSVYEMTQHKLKTHAIEFEILGKSNGEYVVDLSGTGIEKTSATVKIMTPDDEYHISIVQLPTQTDIPQELAIISIVDFEGDLVDVKDTFGKNMKMSISATSARLNGAEITVGPGNIGKVKGILTGPSVLSVASKELGLQDRTLNPVGIATSLELLIPKSVHVGEKFPFVMHEMDSLGIPLKKTIAGFSSSLGAKLDDSYFVLENPGNEKITALSEIGADQQMIQSFSNSMDVSVSVDRNMVRVGENVQLQIINTVSDVSYSITSPFPYEQQSNEMFKITPDSEINDAEIIVSASKKGYLPETKSVTITSEHIVTVKVDSHSTDGKKLQVPYDVEGTILASQTPQSYELKPQQITITFPQKYGSSNGGYEFQNVSVNTHIQNGNTLNIYTDKNYEITANYQRQVQVTIHDGNGGGIYPYGTSIVISAPEKPKLSFLVRDVFDHWVGVDGEKNNPFVMTVKDDVVISAMYHEDYSFLMIIIFAGISTTFAMILKKRNEGYAYKIKNIASQVLDKFQKSLIFRIPKIRKAKKTN